MSKSYGQFLVEMDSKANVWAKSPADNAFIGLHTIKAIADRNGNGDDVFNASKTKKDTTRPMDDLAVKFAKKMLKDIKIAAGGADADGDTDGDVVKGKKKVQEEVSSENSPFNIDESAASDGFNHRDAAMHHIMHPDFAYHMKTGEHVDFYHPKDGDKKPGKVVGNDGKSVSISHGGVHHKFTVRRDYPGMNENKD